MALEVGFLLGNIFLKRGDGFRAADGCQQGRNVVARRARIALAEKNQVRFVLFGALNHDFHGQQRVVIFLDNAGNGGKYWIELNAADPFCGKVPRSLGNDLRREMSGKFSKVRGHALKNFLKAAFSKPRSLRFSRRRGNLGRCWNKTA